MSKILLILSILLINGAYCQTKTIDFKRHSGDMVNFSRSLKNEGLLGGTSNLGVVVPHRAFDLANENSELYKTLKTVEFINDTITVIEYEDAILFLVKSDSPVHSKRIIDTIYHYPLPDVIRKTKNFSYFLPLELGHFNDNDVEFKNFEKEKEDSLEINHKQKIDIEKNKPAQEKENSFSFLKLVLLMLIIFSTLGIIVIKLR